MDGVAVESVVLGGRTVSDPRRSEISRRCPPFLLPIPPQHEAPLLAQLGPAEMAEHTAKRAEVVKQKAALIISQVEK